MFAIPDLQTRKFTAVHALVIFVVLVVAIVLGVMRLFHDDAPQASDVPAVSYEDTSQEVKSEKEKVSGEAGSGFAGKSPSPLIADPSTGYTLQPTTFALPTTYNLAVPFTSQAPAGNWDAVHEETCEEASVLMVTKYFDGEDIATLDQTAADAAMLNMVAYEEAHGYGVSVTLEELAEIITDDVPGFTVEIVERPTVDDIKTLIAKGFPVIVPAAGRELGNPFFSGEGPLYHMLVIRGYDEEHFIVNDPGTKHGQNYVYTFDVLMDAMGDWNNGDPANGASRVLIMKSDK